MLPERRPDISGFTVRIRRNTQKAYKKYIRTGRRGRPKTIVLGKKVETHVHIGAVSSNNIRGQTTHAFVKKISGILNKRAGKKVTTFCSMRIYDYGELISNGADFIGYSYRQANTFHKGGEIDFKEIYSELYLEEV